MGATKYDFSGWATKNNLKCSDGRTIRQDAFKHNDGQIVPLVWQHLHNDPMNVLGHCLLENRSEGVYAFGVFNETDAGQHAKALVQHGDVDALSIYANKLDQRGGDVYHGDIKEVSLVLAGANPGALIDYPILEHSGEEAYDEAVIYTGELLKHSDDKEEEEEKKSEEEEEKKKKPEEKEEPEDKSDEEDDSEDEEGEDLEHADSDEETIQDVFDTLTDKQKNVVYAIIGQALSGEDVEHSDLDLEHADEEGGETIKDVFDTLTDKQKNVVYAIIGEALGEDEEDSEGGEEEMKHNVFDVDSKQQGATLTHDDFQAIFADAKRLGSLKDAVMQHMEDGVLAHAVYNHDDDGKPTTEQTYGIADIRYMFPDARNLNAVPEFISRDMSWVQKVMSATKHTPFSRVKSMFADITMEEARAKGYMKGKLKKDEVFALLKRTTDPQTIYKKQKLDRDDVIDITDFDVVAWMKREMRMMLDEEVARAVLIGDGRSAADEDHISEDHVRSILNDAPLYTIKVGVTAGADDDKTAKNFIREVIKSRKLYKGSGNPTLFTTDDVLTDMLLLEDDMGRTLYDSESALATKLRVKEIVTVPVMESLEKKTAILVNLNDYNIGADKGGEVSMFDDFDIDYNQMKYLIETRLSGALIKPYSAIVFTVGGTSQLPSDNPADDQSTDSGN